MLTPSLCEKVNKEMSFQRFKLLPFPILSFFFFNVSITVGLIIGLGHSEDFRDQLAALLFVFVSFNSATSQIWAPKGLPNPLSLSHT